VTLTDMTLADGRLVRIHSSVLGEEGGAGGITGAAKMATGAAFGAVRGALDGLAEGSGLMAPAGASGHSGFIATRRTVMLPRGAQVSFVLTSPVTIAEQPAR
jgi:hypothetical protein